MANPIRAIIFDFDGLILDTETSLVKAWQVIYSEYDFEIPLMEWAKMLGQSSDPPMAYAYLEAQIGRDVNREELRQRRIALELAALQEEDALPGVRDLIRECRSNGLSLAIASSSEHEWVDQHLARLGLLDCFDVVICADDVESTKPAPDLYQRALEELGVSPDEAIAIEDSEHGVEAARAAGLVCIAVPNPITINADFNRAQVRIDTLEGVRLNDILLFVQAD